MSIVTLSVGGICLLAWCFLSLLPLCYLFFKLDIIFNRFQGFLTNKSIELYYNLFKSSVKPQNGQSYRSLFKDDFYASYGKRHYVIPFLLFISVLGGGLFTLFQSLLIFFNVEEGFLFLKPIAMASFCGAYMWISSDLVHRFRIKDFSCHDMHSWTIRLFISIPLGISFSHAVNESLGVPIAFMLGAFPTKTIFKYSRRFTKQNLAFSDESDIDSLGLQQLQGINKKEAERLQDEGITNITQLAYYDPIDLAMKTNLDFLYIVDIEAQAILWIYITKKLDNDLRVLGVRCSHEIITLNYFLNSAYYEDIAEANLMEISKILQVNINAFKKTIFEIANDPHAQFLCDIFSNKTSERYKEFPEIKDSHMRVFNAAAWGRRSRQKSARN